MTKIKLALKIFHMVLKLEIDHALLDRLSKSKALKVIIQEVENA